jgi:protein SCO1/2
MLTISFNTFSLGGKGPLEMKKDGLKNTKPVVLDKVGIDEKLGGSIDLNLPFKDELGNDVRLGTYFTDKPVFMLLIYYECPTLCNLHLNALMKMLKDFEWRVGDKYEFVAISIDPEESPKLAEKKLQSYLKEYGHPETRNGWHFLTGEQDSITKIADQIGFRYAWDANQEQWAHSAAAYVLTPEGKISYYHYGLRIEPKVMRLSLIEAANNKIGNIVDRMVLFCLQYDPNKKSYAFYAMNIMRVGGFITFIFLGFFLFRFWRKENNTNK